MVCSGTALLFCFGIKHTRKQSIKLVLWRMLKGEAMLGASFDSQNIIQWKKQNVNIL
jgi:hypothetical protein